MLAKDVLYPSRSLEVSTRLRDMKIITFLTLILATSISVALDLTNSFWIWTNELTPSPDWPTGIAPVGARAFRRVAITPPDKTPLSASIIIAVDDQYTLWVDGNEVGTGVDYQTAQGYCVALSPYCYNVFAVEATNGGTVPNPAGVLAAIEITYTDGSTQMVVSDSSWKALNSPTIPTGFEEFNFDDSSWSAATVESPSGGSPWGPIDTPSSPC
ncbi:carbohydrate-binding module family 67 protein [Sphaerobolus stellatus SS14]|uniref:Carbohydrate-binding module family 67 protein n=1 Tax=Sphaerobolus stellatus (strain SS14) TaxID=990650 RepID=A0A0C9UW59_SPHS4|nr:carbohydrate-binding module family 67 protein [Sphaerobolus stellatus SS14]